MKGTYFALRQCIVQLHVPIRHESNTLYLVRNTASFQTRAYNWHVSRMKSQHGHGVLDADEDKNICLI